MLSAGCSPARPHASGTSSQSITTADGVRTYLLHVPSSYSGSTAVPFIVNMHGAGSTSSEEEIYSGFSAKSDAEGFVVIYPQGLTTAAFPKTHWNAFQAPSPEPNDLLFITAMLDSIESQLCIDQDHVFSTGISNGAMMSVRLACSLSSRVAAVAPVAGAYYPPNFPSLNPFETCPDTTPVPMIAFHGTADTSVPYNGGPNGDATLTYRLPIDDNTPAEDVLSDWSIHNGCTAARQESQLSSEVRFVQYGVCTNGADVELYAVDGGGHTWPGTYYDVPALGYVTHQINATDLIWAFFTAHPLGCGGLNSDAAPLDNGPLAPASDATVLNGDLLPDACDPDMDNDGISNIDEDSGASCGGFITDASKMDTDGDHLTDGWECANGSNPNDASSKVLGSVGGDADGDRIPDMWELRGYNGSGSTTDSDGDGCHDLVEIASIDGNKSVGQADYLAVARRSLNIWPPQAAQDYVLDIDKNGVVGDPDRLFVTRAALLSTWLPKTCP